MIKRMLDTNICIYIAKQHPPGVVGKFAEYRRGEVAISAITWGEMYCITPKEGELAMQRLLQCWDVIPFCRKAAQAYALLTARHPNRKANFDRLIAAHAIALAVPLVSNNTADFSLYAQDGLQLENWCG